MNNMHANTMRITHLAESACPEGALSLDDILFELDARRVVREEIREQKFGSNLQKLFTISIEEFLKAV